MKFTRPNDLYDSKGIARGTAYAKLNPNSPQYDPTFPIPVRIGPRSVGWIESEIDDWIERQAQIARVKPGAKHSLASAERGEA